MVRTLELRDLQKLPIAEHLAAAGIVWVEPSVDAVRAAIAAAMVESICRGD